MNLSFLNAFILNLLISALIPFTAYAANLRCENSLFAEFGLSPQYISSVSKRATNQREYIAKKRLYISENMYRGFLREGNLTLPKAIRFILKIDSDLVGNGVKIAENGISRAFYNYNEKAQKKDKFLENYNSHLKGEVENYWKSLLTSWSKEKEAAINFSTPENAPAIYNIIPQNVFGVFVTAARPKAAIDVSDMETQYQVSNLWPGEYEISVPVALDPQMISRITLTQFEKFGEALVRNTSSRRIQIDKTSYGTYLIRVGTADTSIAQDSLETIHVIEQQYQLKVNPDLTYTIVPL